MKKILLITILTMVFALTACSSNEKPVDNTPATIEPDNNPTVTETPDEDDSKEDEEVTETPGEEEEDVAETPANDFQVLEDLSDDLSSFQLQIDDVIYSLPMKYSDFIAHGFVIDEDEDENEKLKSGNYTWTYFNRGDFRIIADIVNADEKELAISECFIGSIEIEKDYHWNGEGVFIALPKGIIFNKSTLDDVKAAYGEPSRIYEDSYYTKFTYDFDRYQEVEILVGVESGVVDTINVKNLIVE